MFHNFFLSFKLSYERTVEFERKEEKLRAFVAGLNGPSNAKHADEPRTLQENLVRKPGEKPLRVGKTWQQDSPYLFRTSWNYKAKRFIGRSCLEQCSLDHEHKSVTSEVHEENVTASFVLFSQKDEDWNTSLADFFFLGISEKKLVKK